jgi:pimeloyl-ACP methyl ester carboxylesterase
MANRITRRRITVGAALFAALMVVALLGARSNLVNHVRHVLAFGKQVGWPRVRLCLCHADEDLTVAREDGLRIAGSLYRGGSDRGPAIVLLHGNTPPGRKLALYEVLATKLAEAGYTVLTIDFAGYGESDDPYQSGSLSALDGSQDVRAALSYLTSLETVDRDSIYIIGHSAGATYAFNSGIAEPLVRKIVAIGPPRRDTERLLKPRVQEYFWKRAQRTHQTVYAHPLPQWFSREIWLRGRLRNDMTRHLAYFSQPDHKPLLLLDADQERQPDLDFLREYYRKISEPKEYVTIADANHYSNTSNLGSFDLYDAETIAVTVDHIDRWLRDR